MAMSPERTTHAVTYLMGEVHALSMACQMLLRTHPNYAAAHAELGLIRQLGLAAIAPAPVPEATVEGFEFIMAALEKVRPIAPANR
jgi:hypothetical protein